MTNEQREHVKLWIQSLRSGNYSQGTDALKDTEDNYCCLGVACDLYQAKGPGDLVVTPTDNGHWTDYDGKPDYLPPRVQAWLGIRTSSGKHINTRAEPDNPGGFECTLTELNDDHGLTFAEIADIIEAALDNPSMNMFVTEETE